MIRAPIQERDLRDTSSYSDVTLAGYVQMLRAGWYVVLLCGLIGALLSLYVGEGDERARFQASATLEIDPHVFVGGGAGVVAVGDPGVPAEEVEAARSAATARALEGGGDAGSLLSRLFVAGDDDTHVLTVALEGPAPTVGGVLGRYVEGYVERRAEAFRARLRRRLLAIDERIEEVGSRIDRLERSLGDGRSDGAQIAERAELETLSGVYSDLLALRQNTELNSFGVREVRLLGGPTVHEVAAFPTAGVQALALTISGLLIGTAIVLARGAFARRGEA
jgi:hypothetical protein